jgi:CBS domain containing-hemolysin-like protein
VSIPALTVLNGLGKIFYPVVWCLSKLTEVVIGRLSRSQPDPGDKVTSDELGYLVKVAEREGTIPADQAALLERVFRFEESIVRDIMVPADRLTAIDIEWDLGEIRRVAKSTGHSRLPVYQGDIDDIQGILHIKQLVGVDGNGSDTEALRRVIRSPFFVSESLLIQDLLRQFKEQRVHLAIVVDDGGDTVGVVTLEDVLEQIVGQIFDETDRAPIYSASDVAGLHYFDGQDSLSRAEEALRSEFDEMDGVDSIGDLLTRLAGQVPIAGSIFVVDGVRFRVLSADKKHIRRVSVQRVEIEDGDDE